MNIIIGIDPDSREHGYAEYIDGNLDVLGSMPTTRIVERFIPLSDNDPDVFVHFSIENVCANNFIYARNEQEQYGKANQSIARKLGMVQQAQIELMRWIEFYGFSYELHKPQKGNWANNKAQFQKVTGWTKRSNEDTRSAAYFGYLALPTKRAIE